MPVALIAAAAPLIGQGISTLLNNQAQGKRTEDINDIFNRQMGDYGLGRNIAFGTGNGTPGMFSNLADASSNDYGRQLQYLYGGDDGGQFGRLNDLIGQVFNPKSISNSFGGNDPYGQNIPGLQGFNQQMSGLAPGAQGQADLARQVFAGGGWTPQSQQSFDQLGGMAAGQNSQQQGLTNMANNIFGSNGQSQNPLWTSFMNAAAQGITGSNPLLDYATKGAGSIFDSHGQTGPTNAGIGAAQNMFANGGMNSILNTLSGTGANVLQQNGLTPTGAQGENAALSVLNNGGATATTDALQGRGIDLANRESLLPMNKVADMARDEASSGFIDNMEAARRQALNRGGGAGATVANGLQNEALTDYSDQGSAMEAQAVRDALVKQQGLQLQQAGLGANMAQQGGALENSRFGTAAGTLSDLEKVAASRFGLGGNFLSDANSGAAQNSNIGLGALGNLAGLQSNREMGALGLIPNISQTGINQAGVYGNLGLGSNQQNLDALKMGSGMYDNVLTSMLGGSNSYNGLIGTQGQYALGAGQLANQGDRNLSDIFQGLFGGNMNASQQGLNRTNSNYTQQQQGVNNQFNQQNFSGTQQNNNATLYNNLFGTMMNWMTGQGNQANAYAYANANPSTNPWAGLAGQAVTAGMGPLAGLFGGGGNSATTTTLNYPGMPRP